MSWVKKRGQQAPAGAPPPVQMYNPNQHSNQETQWPNQQPQDNWYNQPKEEQKINYWQQPYQGHDENSQQYGNYQEYYQNNTQYQQPYGNLQYNQQYSTQNNPYATQQQPPEGDGWNTNWGWGDEDNSNVQTQPNPVVESFTNDEAWNWNLEENRKSPKEAESEIAHTASAPLLDSLPGRRNKLETPQWSVESQLSQESSDDVLQTSESDKSRMLSRSSTISHSPISTQEPSTNLDNLLVKEESEENKEILSQVSLGPPSINNLADDKGNPYKRSAGLSHKAAHKFRTSNITPPVGVYQQAFSTQSVNLETLPDNSEQPDPVPLRKLSPATSSPWAENNEAPINDRNQYLETAQLSDVDLNNYNQIPETTSQDDTFPPPGLRRMVPGQTVGGAETIEPPEGLRRMIPGESSSPESSLRPQNDSDPEFNEMNSQRSATIGADFPTSSGTNRSETIGADTSPDPGNKKGRRDSVEGQIHDGDVAGLVSSVRNLKVGDVQDDGNSGDGSARRPESSESEREGRQKSPGDRRDRRYKEDGRDTRRGRYTPEDYRDKKYDRRRYKDRRYEEDTDYYSDKERERRHRDEREYDRKYNSLRKEKDRRRKDYPRDPRDPRKDNYYYRYEEDYENESRSRASSRSDSIHDSYRERDRGHERDRRDRRHREKERHRRHRDPFNPYMQGYGYDIYSQYYQQYHYYENLRKTNPQAYAQLYRKYYQETSGEPPYGAEDRASVHSGRSSANDELTKDRYTRQSYYSQTSLPHLGGYYRGSQTHSISGQYGLDDSSFVRTLDQTDNSLNYEDPNLTAQRLTPAKFATAHLKASISSGKLIKILPHYPLDGQTATVELCNLENLLQNDEEYQELKRFPGPLMKGITHKKTIIEYCESKIKEAYSFDIGDKESYILMWELLILLIRQNGMVVGADIAELLLKNRPQEVQRPSSAVSSVSSNVGETQEISDTSNSATNLKEEEITNRFREYLLYGSGKEALEWAMKHGLWGHALFLASKLDKRTYANVMMRFANGLTMNDPLQTLYQLLSGRTPAAVTCVADEKWGDWRPHLAMILSNSTQRPELNCKAITILGDTLMGRGSLYAAQFCYLMAEVGFGQYGNTDAKLVLLGANHNKAFMQFATNEAIHMTEIYEYARSLNDDDFNLVHFQRYKYLLATRLADVGLLEKALSYLEKIAIFVVKNPSAVDAGFVNDVTLLADRLKFYDPVGDGEVEVDFDSSRVENSWLKDLRRVQDDLNGGLITQQSVAPQATNQDAWQQQYDYQQPNWNTSEQVSEPTLIESSPQAEQLQESHYQDQLQYWSNQQQQWAPEQTYQQEPIEQPQQQNYYGALAQTEPDQVEKQTPEDIPQAQISLPNQRERKDENDDKKIETAKEAITKPKATDTNQDKSGNGWFGGIFSKLTLKPKNQMKLPDDKNPSIVWDPEKKRWINTDEDNGEVASSLKPPPKMADLMPKPQTFMAVQQQLPEPVQENGSIPRSNQPNMFKMQKSRNLKKSYIDVFNPNSKGGQAAASVAPHLANSQQPMNFFVPQPINDPNAPTDFLTPAPPMTYDENSQMSRWSSASSLSREVQSYTMHKPISRR